MTIQIMFYYLIFFFLVQVGEVIKNPEIASLVPTLLKALTDPNDHTKYALDILLQVRKHLILCNTSDFLHIWVLLY